MRLLETDGPILYHFHNKWCIVIFLFLIVVGCAGPKPIEEYVLARAAIQSAKRADAPRYAPGFWSQAEEIYASAQKKFEDRRYEIAKDEFEQARLLAEKAEEQARLKRLKLGGGL